MKQSKRRQIHLSLAVLLAFVAAILIFPLIQHTLHPALYIKSDQNILELTQPFLVEGEITEDTLTLTRGEKVILQERGDTTSKVRRNGEIIDVPNQNLAKSLDECVAFSSIYPRKLVNLREERGGKLTSTVVQKGEELKVVNVNTSDLDPATGEISWFEVEKDGKNYFVAGTNMETTHENAMKIYAENLQVHTLYDSVFGPGYAKNAYVEQADFRGKSQPDFPDNPRREDVQAIHVNLDILVKEIDYILELKNTTGINALAIALKGPDGKLRYESEVPQHYFNNPENALDQTVLTKQEMIDLIKMLKDNGFYVIGRMETFADAALAWDRPEWAVTVTETGSPLMLSDDYWVSAYSRDAWMYNGDLVKEFAEMGCNEVQFDFVRFADNGARAEATGYTDYKNTYNESKVSAVQGFLFYIREELEPLHVYCAADIYAGPVVENNDYDIGHYYPAMAAATNIINPMVYLDTFNLPLVASDETDQWERDTIAAFIQVARKNTSTLQNPALLRLYLQGYNETSAERVEQEIRGIMDAGATGYMFWTDRGDVDTLDRLKKGFINSYHEGLDSSSADKEEDDDEDEGLDEQESK